MVHTFKKIKKSSNGDILKKLENFDSGFWKDEEVTIDPRMRAQLKKETPTEEPDHKKESIKTVSIFYRIYCESLTKV